MPVKLLTGLSVEIACPNPGLFETYAAFKVICYRADYIHILKGEKVSISEKNLGLTPTDRF